MRIVYLAVFLCSTAIAADTVDIDTLLFVQNPQGPKPGIHVIWIPEPLQKYCMGKTAEECSKIDYCNRTTNRNVATCKNVARIPPYPAGMHPRRVLSITYLAISPATSPVKGIAMLQTFYNSQPKESLDHLSMSARIKAKVKLTSSANDDDFDVLEFFPIAP